MERSKFISGVAGVMVLILIMVAVYLYKHMPRPHHAQPHMVAAAAVAAPSPTALLLPPPVLTRPVPRPVIAIYKPKHAVIKFSSLEKNFTGTWAAYPQLCQSAWYQISGKQINVAGGGSCDVRGVQTASQGTTLATSATVVLDCHHNDYTGQETWNITQPRKDALNLRELHREGSGNGLSLYRCPPQFASN